ncbi:phage baseplate assembly protein V [Escherichia coli]|nr:phage baseplate assembly protein V [Escherichia coli]
MPVMNTHQNIAAFLDMLAVSEGTANHPLTKNRGYDVIVTGLDGKPEIFTDYSDHPFAHGRPAKVFNRRGEKSTASGRYQQLYLFWPHYRKQLALPDFSPLSQDRLAIQLIRERGALDDIRAGRIERAISRCRNIWASLPGAGYGQREHSLEKLVTVWRTAGGVSGIKTASVTASDSVTATVPVVMVKASTRITLDTPEVVCTNRLITGTLEVQKGGTMRGNIKHTGGELSSNGKVLHTHKHPGDSGGTTGSPL